MNHTAKSPMPARVAAALTEPPQPPDVREYALERAAHDRHVLHVEALTPLRLVKADGSVVVVYPTVDGDREVTIRRSTIGRA